MQASTAIVWLTHFDDPEADAAFARLRNEASQWGSVVKVRHDPAGSDNPGAGAVLGISERALAAALPDRFAQMQRLGRAVHRGFPDLLRCAVAQALGDFEFHWFIEYDVDFSGPWSVFFSEFADCRTDLLSTSLYPRLLSEDWVHWSWFKSPPSALARSIVRSFVPVVRLSRRFLNTYQRESGRWEGHAEAVLPSVALHAGLAVEDIGGEGPMTPPQRRGRLYSSTRSHRLDTGSFRVFPAVDSHYFPNRVDASPPNCLWHPIKTEAFRAERRRRAALAVPPPGSRECIEDEWPSG